jgi:uncharacterized protein (DUF305 family)
MRLKWILIGTVISAAASAQMLNKPSGATFMDNMGVAMKRMSKDMAEVSMTGDVDHDFAQMMIPHHQGAIDMAKVQLLYGKDPQMRRLAQEIITDQQLEIELMQHWLKEHDSAQTKKDKQAAGAGEKDR